MPPGVAARPWTGAPVAEGGAHSSTRVESQHVSVGSLSVDSKY
jgi:hypothetical protein